MAKAFGKYGFELTDPETHVKLNIPKSFKATYNYKLPTSMFEQNLEEITDKVLRQT